MHVALVNPLIPQNSGNIARLCAGTNTHLHLVGKLGFSLQDKYLKRAGLDYWPNVKLAVHASFDAFLRLFQPAASLYLFSTRSRRRYTEIRFDPDCILVFGAETTGLPEDMLDRFPDRVYTIPINNKIRSLNLANSVSIVLFEALRQMDFEPIFEDLPDELRGPNHQS